MNLKKEKNASIFWEIMSERNVELWLSTRLDEVMSNGTSDVFKWFIITWETFQDNLEQTFWFVVISDKMMLLLCEMFEKKIQGICRILWRTAGRVILEDFALLSEWILAGMSKAIFCINSTKTSPVSRRKYGNIIQRLHWKSCWSNPRRNPWRIIR